MPRARAVQSTVCRHTAKKIMHRIFSWSPADTWTSGRFTPPRGKRSTSFGGTHRLALEVITMRTITPPANDRQTRRYRLSTPQGTELCHPKRKTRKKNVAAGAALLILKLCCQITRALQTLYELCGLSGLTTLLRALWARAWNRISANPLSPVPATPTAGSIAMSSSFRHFEFMSTLLGFARKSSACIGTLQKHSRYMAISEQERRNGSAMKKA